VSNAIRVRSLCVGVALALAGSSAFAAEPDPNRVLVQFKPGSKANVQRSLQGAGARFHHSFDALNAFAVTVPPQALAGLRNNPNIQLIEQDSPRYPMAQTVPYGVPMVQAPDLVATGADGSGIKVCIIDSGIKANHEDLSSVSMNGYASSGQAWSTDTCGHGTHVAGTIAAANNSLGVLGVSPGAVSLHIVKVFDGEACGWSYASSLIDAANRCEAAGAKVINMSLGGGRANNTERNGFASLYGKGVLSIAAAGNGGNTQNSYPASYDSVISVAAIDSNKLVADFSQKNSQVELSAPGVSVLSTYPISGGSASVGTSSYMASALEGSPNAQASAGWVSGGLCDGGGSFGGKVVLCERGDISFADKVLNAQNGGAVGVIIYNNASGGFSGTLNGIATSIPSVSISQEDGQDILANGAGKTATVDARVSTNANGYAVLDGTSMATPHVAGVAAIVWSANPAATNQQVRDALASTAEDLGSAGRDNSYGFGLVRALDAANALTGGGGGEEPPPPPPPGDATVLDVSIAFTSQGPNRTARGTAVVSAAGASVTGCFSGAVSGCGTGTANSSGSITFASSKYKNNNSVTFCVTGLDGQSFTTQHCVTGSP
jgi:subtilisin family serine protease